MPGSLEGPLGPLRGMFWDPVRAKYFPNPRESTAVPNQPRQKRPNMRALSPTDARAAANKDITGDDSSNKRPNGGRDGASNKDQSSNSQSGAESSKLNNQIRVRSNPFRRLAGRVIGSSRPTLDAVSHEDRMRGMEQVYLANLVYQDTLSGVYEEPNITGLIPNYMDYDYFAKFDGGRMEGRKKDSEEFTVIDYVEPWIRPTILCNYHGQSDPRQLMVGGVDFQGDEPLMNRQVINFGAIDGLSRAVKEENIVFSTYDKTVAVGCRTAIVQIDYNYPLPTQRALLAVEQGSDMLALHQSCENIVYAGLRNSEILSGDFRDCRPSNTLKVAATLNHKAIVKIQRLSDSAVPFGLLVSGMDHKLVIFDIRFTKQPLRELAGHVNPFHSDLGLATTDDDYVVFAGQGDNRIRAWSLRDGQRLLPDDAALVNPGKICINGSDNPLKRVFEHRPTAIIVKSGVLDVGVGRDVHRFSRPVPNTM